MYPGNPKEYFSAQQPDTPAQTLPVHAVLMAGGLGSRLGLLTQQLPKPLLQVGEKRLIDYLLLLLRKHNILDIHIAIRYMGHKIVRHLLQFPPPPSTHLRFIRETKPLGTFGALSLLEEVRHPYILVINSDLLTTANLSKLFREMLVQEADMIVGTVPYEVEVPYGILKSSRGQVEKFIEKPQYRFDINAGIYLFRKEVLDLIPFNQFFDAPECIDLLLTENRSVKLFPIENYWQDISLPKDYEQACEDIQSLSWD